MRNLGGVTDGIHDTASRGLVLIDRDSTRYRRAILGSDRDRAQSSAHQSNGSGKTMELRANVALGCRVAL
jgi:hypothetical protein